MSFNSLVTNIQKIFKHYMHNEHDISTVEACTISRIDVKLIEGCGTWF